MQRAHSAADASRSFGDGVSFYGGDGVERPVELDFTGALVGVDVHDGARRAAGEQPTIGLHRACKGYHRQLRMRHHALSPAGVLRSAIHRSVTDGGWGSDGIINTLAWLSLPRTAARSRASSPVAFRAACVC